MILDRTAADIAAAVRAREASAAEIAEAALSRAEERNVAIGAYLSVVADVARAHARKVDERIAAGESLPLAGVPLAVKDNMCLAGTRTTAGSKILANWIAPYTATAVQRLLDAGALPIGKANLDEFAMGSSCENSALGKTHNPWDLSRVPGGSSGGSTAAVASAMATIALGSDTGGSIREPAAFCGVVGFKPTYGRISRYGLIAFASSLDQIGPIAKTVEDAALVYDAMAGKDPCDATSVDRAVEATERSTRDNLRGLRIGIVKEFGLEALEPAVRAVYEAAYRDLERLGAELVEVSLPTADYGVATYYLIAPAECSSNLARYDGVRFGARVDRPSLTDMYLRTRGAGFGAEVKRRVMLGTYALSSGYYDAYYRQAQKVRTLVGQEFDAVFEQVDAIVCPTSPSVAFPMGSRDDPLSMYMCDVVTLPANLAGVPGISVPCGAVDGLPVGLQVIAPRFADSRVFRVAHAYEQATDWHLARSPFAVEAA